MTIRRPGCFVRGWIGWGGVSCRNISTAMNARVTVTLDSAIAIAMVVFQLRKVEAVRSGFGGNLDGGYGMEVR